MVDGPNLYSYVGNNAVNFVDPFGWCKDKGKNGEQKPSSPDDPRPKDPMLKEPTKGQPLPDEFTRKARWWEWFIWVPWRFLYNYEVPPGYQGPDFGPVPPTHKDWPGSRKPRQEDFAI